MILAFFEKYDVMRRFEAELKRDGACIYHSAEAEPFGDGVSNDDSITCMGRGFSVSYYEDIFAKNVASKAIENDLLILDRSPSFPNAVEKCPVVYITDRSGDNNEAFGQLLVKYTGDVRETLQNARTALAGWLEKYGEGKDEKYFYRQYLAAVEKIFPQKIRLIAFDGLWANYVAGVALDFSEERASEIKELIQKVEKESGCKVYSDSSANSDYFNWDDDYLDVVWSKDAASFLEDAKQLAKGTSPRLRRGSEIRSAIERQKEKWFYAARDIFAEQVEKQGPFKPQSCRLQISCEGASGSISLEELGFKVVEDEEKKPEDVEFMGKVADYVREDLAKLIDGCVEVETCFYARPGWHQEDVPDLEDFEPFFVNQDVVDWPAKSLFDDGDAAALDPKSFSDGGDVADILSELLKGIGDKMDENDETE